MDSPSTTTHPIPPTAVASCTSFGSDETLLADLGIQQVDADELLGYSDDEDEEEDERDEGEEDLREQDSEDEDSDQEFESFKRRVRVEETERAEMARRPGGVKTQKAVVRDWNVSGQILCSGVI